MSQVADDGIASVTSPVAGEVGLTVAAVPIWATGITAYLKNNGTLEAAQHIANHESPRTTKLYDRRQDEISLDEVERIAI